MELRVGSVGHLFREALKLVASGSVRVGASFPQLVLGPCFCWALNKLAQARVREDVACVREQPVDLLRF